MPDYARLSIWENEPHEMTWYDFAIGRTQPPQYRLAAQCQTEKPKTGSKAHHGSAVDVVTDHAWFYELKALDEAERQGVSASPASPAMTQGATPTAEKGPREVVAARQDPYFEYMFVDAGSESDASVSSIEERWEQDSNPDDVALIDFDDHHEPPKLEQTDSKPVSTHLSEEPPSEWRHIVHPIPMSEDEERYFWEQEAISAYVGKLSPTLQSETHRIHLELTSYSSFSPDSSTYGDESDDECCYPVDTCFGVIQDPFSKKTAELENACVSIRKTHPRTILKPKSPRRTLAKRILAKLDRNHQNSFNGAIRKNRHMIFRVESTCKKRAAADASLDDVSMSDDEHNHHCHKKVQVVGNDDSGDTDEDIFGPAYLLYAGDRASFRTVSKDFFKHKALPSPPKGYVGQFDGMLIDQDKRAVFPFQPHDAVPRVENAQTFGANTHPNGTFTHTHFSPDPFAAMSEYNAYNLSSNDPLVTCMSFATDMTISSCHPNMVALRSAEEEILRREAHLECSSARLEGVAVGFWRYLQGSYGLEEYRQAHLCVCWDSCQCNKMCTRYADLKCPCSKDIIVHGDD